MVSGLCAASRSPLEPDTGACAEDSQYMFARALHVADLLHTIDNLTHDIHLNAMKCWGRFAEGLGALCELLCERATRDLFIRFCLEAAGAEGAARAPAFNRGFPKVASWRWGTTMTVLSWLLPLESDLRRYWDAGVYEAALSKRAEPEVVESTAPGERPGVQRLRVDTRLLTKTIWSDFFWLYCRLCLNIQTLLDTLGGWAESCPCHGRTADSLSFRVDGKPTIPQGTRWFRDLVGQDARMFDTCPFSGKRAPELACGAADAVFSAIADAASSQFLADAEWKRLSPDDAELAQTDWENARAYLEGGLRIKISFWCLLPWKLCGLGHSDAHVARTCARECVALYSSAPNPDGHHRVTQEFLGVGGPSALSSTHLPWESPSPVYLPWPGVCGTWP